VSLGYVISSDLYYWKMLPKSPDYSSGRVNEIVVSHGSVRYGTVAEENAMHIAGTLAVFACSAGLIAGILNSVYKDF
jgi:hypothetical protein